jgi:hypothetical protein
MSGFSNVNAGLSDAVMSAASVPLPLDQYADDLMRTGTAIYSRSPSEFWMRYESWGAMRMPTFAIGEPPAATLREVLGWSRAVVATYLLEPDAEHPANAELFICADREYSIEKLPKDRRQNVRRGMRELRIEPLTTEQVLTHGFRAFSETRSRVGLTDGTPEGFAARFRARGKCRGHAFLGAWHGDQLIAYLSTTLVDDWVEIEGGFSTNDARLLRPNDTLVAMLLLDHLASKRCRLVSYGLSSIQADTNASGLHEFKRKLGFEAKPVHRVFAVHPFLRPFVNRLTQRCVRKLLKVAPQNRILKKGDGMLSILVGERNRR